VTLAQRSEQNIANSNSIKLVFSDLKEEYTFTRRRVNPKLGFATLPADVDSLQLMGMPLTSCSSTGFRFRVSYDVMNNWGRAKDGIGGYSGLYFLAKSSRGVNFFVKMVLNAEQQSMQNSAEDSYQGLTKAIMDVIFTILEQRGFSYLFTTACGTVGPYKRVESWSVFASRLDSAGL